MKRLSFLLSFLMAALLSFSTGSLAMSDDEYRELMRDSPEFARAEKELNAAWKSLMGKAGEERLRKSLVRGQRAWLKDRDLLARQAFLNEFGNGAGYRAMKRTMGEIYARISKERAEFLLEISKLNLGAEFVEYSKYDGESEDVRWYPLTGMKKIDDAIRKFAGPAPADARQDASDGGDEEEFWTKSYTSGRMTDHGKIISYLFAMSEYNEGAAHGMTAFQTLCFEKSTGRSLSLGELFKDRKKAVGTIRKAVISHAIDNGWQSPGEDMTVPEENDFNAFEIEPDGGISIIVQPYQFGSPYVEAGSKITIGAGMLKAAGPKYW